MWFTSVGAVTYITIAQLTTPTPSPMATVTPTPSARVMAPPQKASPAKASALKSCPECLALAKLEKQIRADVLKENPAYAPKSLAAAKIITDMARKNPTLDEVRIKSVVGIYRVLAPKEIAIVNLTFPVINTNREAIEAEIAALPKAESTLLMEAIDEASKSVSLESGAKGASPTPPPAGTPGVNETQ